MKLFILIGFSVFALTSSTLSFALEGETPDAAAVSSQPKSSGVTIVSAHSKDHALSSKPLAPVKKEKPAKHKLGTNGKPQTESVTPSDSTSQSETSSTPPGLSKKGELSKGLQKKDKTPSGWEKGKKTGWEKDMFKGKEDLFGSKNKEKSGKEKHKSFGKTFGTDEK